MDPETELDTDLMILDYTCCKATHELILRRIAELSDRSIPENEESSNTLLSIFDSFKTLMEHKDNDNASSLLSRDMQAKLQLLTFTRLFFHRARQSRLNSHYHTATKKDRPSFSATDYGAMLDILKIPRKDRLSNRHDVVSLIDLFPDLLSLCSAMSARTAASSSSFSLGDLLGKYLLQSALEQYTIFNKAASEARTEVVQVIEGEKEWAALTAQYIALLSPTSHGGERGGGGGGEETSLEAHFNHLAQHFPAFEFECMMIMQLQEFLFQLDTPVLVKLETGESLETS